MAPSLSAEKETQSYARMELPSVVEHESMKIKKRLESQYTYTATQSGQILEHCTTRVSCHCLLVGVIAARS